MHEFTSTASGTANAVSHRIFTECAMNSLIVPIWVSKKGNQNKTLTYAILDDQSDTSFVSDNMIHLLDIKGVNVSLNVSTINGDEVSTSLLVKGLQLESYDQSSLLVLDSAYNMHSHNLHIICILAIQFRQKRDKYLDARLHLAGIICGKLLGI